MRSAFRQGLISYQKDSAGLPQFLLPSSTNGYVALNVAPTPVMVSFAHGDSNYLQTFETAAPAAWPVTQGVDNYFYWDIDLLTANVTFATTVVEPVVSTLEPIAPANDQHWFDLNVNKMRVWSVANNRWVDKVRVFAGSAPNGNTNQLVSRVTGSQVGLVGEFHTGHIMLDHSLRPLRTSSGEFLTTDTRVRIKTTVGTSGVLATPPNAFIPVRAGENIPAMSLVYFSGPDIVSLASSDPALIGQRTPIGIIQDELFTNEVGVLTQSGDITYDQWDWAGVIGRPLYSNSFGQLVAARPPGLLAHRVGVVKNRNTILFGIDAETEPQVYTASGSQVIIAGTTPISAVSTINGIGERVVTISSTLATPTHSGLMSGAHVESITNLLDRALQLEADVTTLETTKAEVNHTHTPNDVIGLDVLLDGKLDVDANFDNRYSRLLHTHEIAEVNGLQVQLTSKAARTTGMLPFSRIFASVNQTGATDVGSGTTLQQALDGKAAVNHVHSIAEVTGLQGALDGKAPVNHTHAIADVTDLQVTLDSFLPLTGGTLTGDLNGQAAFFSSGVIAGTIDPNFGFTQGIGLQGNGTILLPTGTGSPGQVLTSNGGFSNVTWTTPSTGSAGASTLSELTDVGLMYSPSHGQVLTYDSFNNKWEGVFPPSPVNSHKPRPMATVTLTSSLDFGSSAHHNTHFRVKSATLIYVTVVADSYWPGYEVYWESNGFPYYPGAAEAGSSAIFGKHGAGNVVFVAGPGVTINTPDTLTISRLHGKVTLIKVGPNEWDLEGNLATA